MNNYENQLDEIRIKLFEETIGMEKSKIIELVNSHAQKIAHDFGINITKETKIESRPPSMVGSS
jgi:hypothetical protein